MLFQRALLAKHPIGGEPNRTKKELGVGPSSNSSLE
jgi:hypothetical protein